MRKSSWSTRRAATRFEQSSRRNKNLSLKTSCVENATHPGKTAGISKIQSNFDDELAGVRPGEEHVDGGVKTEVFRKPVAFVVRSGNAHDAAAADLSNLTDNAAGWACSCGDNHRLALLG